MKRSTVLLFSCLALAGGTWLAHVVWAQTAETNRTRRLFTITKSQLDKYVTEKVAKAVAAEREKAAPRSHCDKPVTDDQVLKAENWHRAVFDKMEFVVYTGPGQAMMHHWVADGQTACAEPGDGGRTSPQSPLRDAPESL